MIRLYDNSIRWHKESHPDTSEPTAEIRWHYSSESINWPELFTWTNAVINNDRIPEILVIDHEGSIVTYELSICEPMGNLTFDLDRFKKSLQVNQTKRYSQDKSSINHVGIPTRWGHRLNPSESNLLTELNQSSTASVHLDLLYRGLALRSGFKYGTHWRAYTGPVGKDHAPYLIDTPDNAPESWSKACLSARLAAGVNKDLLIAINGTIIQYLQINRPPSNRRWTNLHRR